ncbi:presequence protease, mitochondrial isoform X2 [Eurytemora carolleeae]|uniref:presequence protease, mitochondrial isoform X2 n=1 Tax=Eurytemora carolleeae TaxID=1294199 RepID=UPI000C759049|nr:presequence protease, mitochondrial isoform X2 [Eurytemora carolleeae]|eukprot:XP_023336821.1 presequence protease, mitochondrial-like isoform X2 [Eurytemora affinis]
MACADENNAFSINFRTTPMNSTGVAHILEHTTLCGSKTFPVRDPFMKMLNRSLSTFMNAMTGPDYTLYPFSTCNHQDYLNLMNVYLDSVFNPLLREQDFLQEGWRLENDELEDKTSPLIIKGVVFNEMKGAYSDSQQLFGQKLLNSMLPGHTYSYSSGGFPLNIPELSWEELKSFHASHYHPSNSRIFTYGDIPLETHLSTLDSYLDKFQYLNLNTAVPKETRWLSPRSEKMTCASDSMSPDPSKQSSVAVSYLLSDITELKESFTMQVLGELLTEGPSAPFYKSLIQTGIGAGFSPVTGYDNHIKETTFTVGLQNISSTDVNMIVEKIENTFDQVIKEGFSQDRIDAVLHSYELGLKHRSGNFGLNLIMNMTAYCNHSTEPLEYLRVNKILEWFKAKLKEDNTYLQKKVKQYFKDNTHKLVLSMDPEAGFVEQEQRKFEDLEHKLRANLTQEEKDEIRRKNLELLESQDMKEDASCLPTLRVGDISEEYTGTSLTHLSLAGVPTQLAIQPTNQVSYFRALINTSHVPLELKPYLPLFSSFLSKLGAKDLNYEDLDTRIELSTGGLGASCHVTESPDDLFSITDSLLLSSHCLDRNIEKMFELWSNIFEQIHLKDTNRVSTLVKMAATSTSNGIAHSGHRYAMSCAAAAVNPVSALTEIYSGMQHVNHLSKLSTQDGNILMEKFRLLSELLLNKNCMKVALNTVPETQDQLVRGAENFVSALSGTCSPLTCFKEEQFQVEERKLHHVVPFPINFTSQSLPTVHYTHPDSAPLRVLAAVMSSKYLHPEIREKGGAYGGGATAGSGTFTFYSYRDPKNLETFSVYRKAGEWAAEGNFSDQDVEEGQLRIFQRLDEPVQPGYRGLRVFLSGVEDSIFKEHRIREHGIS